MYNMNNNPKNDAPADLRHVTVSQRKRHKKCSRHVPDTHCFSMEEAAEHLDLHMATLRQWTKEGVLKPIDNKRPILLHGMDLRHAIEVKNESRKKPTKDHELYCQSCKCGRAVDPSSIKKGMAKNGRVTIKANCATCGTKICYLGTEATIDKKIAAIKSPEQRLLKLSHGKRRGGGSIPLSSVSNIYNAENERRKYEYLSYLKEVRGFSPKSLKTYSKNLLAFDHFNQHDDYRNYSPDLAKRYKKHLSASGLTGYTICPRLNTLKDFLTWLREQKTYKSRLHITEIAYLNVSRLDKQAYSQKKFQAYPSHHNLVATIEAMPEVTLKQRRNKAMMALLAMTGLRESEIIHLRLKHFTNEDGPVIIIDPTEISTKTGNYHVTAMLPIAPSIMEFFLRYHKELVEEHLWNPHDPLFPKMHLAHGGAEFAEGTKFMREPLKDAQMLSRICKQAFLNVTGEAYSPHKVRHTICELLKSMATNAEETKAASQNMGHATTRHMMETYGQLDHHRQIETMQRMAKRNPLFSNNNN